MSDIDVSTYDFIDFPTAWKLAKAYPHQDPHCSYVTSGGALLCDCGTLYANWDRLRRESGLPVPEGYDEYATPKCKHCERERVDNLQGVAHE